MRRISLYTLGCKLNQAETSAIGEQFVSAGFDLVAFGAPSDVVVINTCTVTDTADKECRQVIRRALRHNPEAFVLVTGCYAQLHPEEVASIDGVDLVLGSRLKTRALEMAGDCTKRDTPRVEVTDVTQEVRTAGGNGFGPAFSQGRAGRVRAFLKVQDGCDYSCSFCTIPMARGPSRSQSIAATVEQAEALVARGFKEVVLTGVNVGDYGRSRGRTLFDLLVALHRVRGLGRLKISSIEPNLLTDDIVDLMAESDRLMPHVHLPLQSGSDRILAKMRRRYRVSDYGRRLRHLLDRLPHCAVGADVIVGFPGERQADFAETAQLLEKLPVTYLHVFTYSERADTPAARMAGHLPRAERRRRTRLLRELSDRKRAHFAQAQRGRRRPVLFERVTAKGDLTGLTDHYLRVEVPPLPGTRAEAWLNRVAPVEVGAWQDRGVALGRLVDGASPDRGAERPCVGDDDSWKAGDGASLPV